MLLAEGIIPIGTMARYQVTLDIALRWSAGIGINRILSTCRSSGAKNKRYLLERENLVRRPLLKWRSAGSKNQFYLLKELFLRETEF